LTTAKEDFLPKHKIVFSSEEFHFVQRYPPLIWKNKKFDFALKHRSSPFVEREKEGEVDSAS
jgi:hypothetical protein